MAVSVWQQCLDLLQEEYPAQQFNTWIRPLQAEANDEQLILLAPNRFVVDWVRKNYISRIEELATKVGGDVFKSVSVEIGTNQSSQSSASYSQKSSSAPAVVTPTKTAPDYKSSHLNRKFVFDSFVEGNSNQLARAACMQVGDSPGEAYNPLFIYGGVGLGKTHLMHACGNAILMKNPDARILYLHSERFVADMVKALQCNTINDF